MEIKADKRETNSLNCVVKTFVLDNVVFAANIKRPRCCPLQQGFEMSGEILLTGQMDYQSTSNLTGNCYLWLCL